MSRVEKQLSISGAGDNEALRHLRQAAAEGKHWYIALLESISLWSLTEEDHEGCHLCYLIADEAFDWLLLAQRLCQAVDGQIPDGEVQDLLFCGKPPLDLTKREFKNLIGSDKYRAYLNYFYGVTVEEALILAVENEIGKEQQALGYGQGRDFADEAYLRLYGASKPILLERFRTGKGYPKRKSTGLGELKEFTYWLFKQRLQLWDKARVASDTKKGLEELQRQWAIKGRSDL